MQRHSFEHDEMIFSFLDSGGEGRPLLALHGHWMGASDFVNLADDLAPDWRLIALDQRGFGETDHTDRHSLPNYAGDAVALLDHLNISEAVPVLGHSFGGVVAYHLAAESPERVSGLIIEEIGVELEDDSAPFVASWAGTFHLREALEDKIGLRLAPYLQQSIRRVDEGWRLTFEPDEFLLSEQAINGNHWSAWLASHCPALVIAGNSSKVCDLGHLRDMATRRNNTEFAVIKAGHSVHVDAYNDFKNRISQFLTAHC